MALGSAFMGRLMPLIGARLSDDTAVGAHCLSWEGDVSAAGQSVPLRLAAAYPPNQVADEDLWGAVDGAMVRHAGRILEWLTLPPQTNEVRRAAALIPSIWWALNHVGPRPVVLSELGASAGLNLMLDRFSLAIDGQTFGPGESTVRLAPDWSGPYPAPRAINVIDRRGVDLAPMHASNPNDALRLLSYLWPDQPDRLTRTQAALAMAEAPVDQGDAAPWVQDRLGTRFAGALHVVYSTIAAQYFPETTRAHIAESLRNSGARARPHAPLLHLAMEADDQSPGAGVAATLWTGDTRVQQHLARICYHGIWLNWVASPFGHPQFPLR